MKICPNCEESIDALCISYYRKTRKYYSTYEDEEGIKYYDEDEDYCDDEDDEVFDMVRSCPNCGYTINVPYSSLADYIDEDDQEEIDYRKEYNKKKLKQEADKLKKQNKKLVNKLILNSIIASPSS